MTQLSIPVRPLCLRFTVFPDYLCDRCIWLYSFSLALSRSLALYVSLALPFTLSLSLSLSFILSFFLSSITALVLIGSLTPSLFPADSDWFSRSVIVCSWVPCARSLCPCPDSICFCSFCFCCVVTFCHLYLVAPNALLLLQCLSHSVSHALTYALAIFHLFSLFLCLCLACPLWLLLSVCVGLFLVVSFPLTRVLPLVCSLLVVSYQSPSFFFSCSLSFILYLYVCINTFLLVFLFAFFAIPGLFYLYFSHTQTPTPTHMQADSIDNFAVRLSVAIEQLVGSHKCSIRRFILCELFDQLVVLHPSSGHIGVTCR